MSKRAERARKQASSDGSPELLSYDEAAEYLGMDNKYWVIRRKQRGELPYVKMGRLVRFRREDLDAYIEENFHPAADR